MIRLIISTASFLLTTSMFITGCQTKTDPMTYAEYLDHDWQLFSSEGLKVGGHDITKPGFRPDTFYLIHVPSTIMSGLIQNGLYPDVYLERRLEDVDRTLFEHPWWYRKAFFMDDSSNRYYHLCFEGINYKANIWLNGQLIADTATIEGPFGMWDIDISGHVQRGENVLAVEVFPPRKGELTIGFVDWSPEAPDRNTGLWRGVRLRKSGPVSLWHPHVTTHVNTETLDEAHISMAAIAKNHTDEPQTIIVQAKFDGREVSGRFILLPNEETQLVLSPSQFDKLIIRNPRLWWPANLGEPHLYDMDISFIVDNQVSDRDNFRFGIRQVEAYRNANDHLGFKVNGEKILIKGGGWVDDMLLADSDEKVMAQVDYTRHMNLNTIRLEGFWGRNKTLYDRCDEQGIMLMIGWSCQWEWEYYLGRPQDHLAIV